MNAILEQINSTGLKFVEFALPMFVQSVVLIIILLLADFALRKKVRAVFRYWIWLLVLVKLVLPTSLSSPLSLGYFFGDRLTYVERAETTPEPQANLVEPVPVSVPPFIDLVDIEADRFTPAAPPIIPEEKLALANPAAPSVISAIPLSWQGAVFLTWLTVVIAMVLLLLQRAIFVRGLVAQAKEANGFMADTLESCHSSMSVKRKLGLKISANATSPAVCGLFSPVILVPQNLASSLPAGQLRAVLLHELAHIRRGDLFVNLAQTVLQIIYFYNPLLWLANCVIRRIREQAVDEMVLVAMGEKATQYPQTLVSVAKLAFKRPVLSLRLIGVVESKSALSARIKHILNRPMPKKAKLGILGLLVVIIIGSILLPMASSMPDQPRLVIKGVVKDAQTGEPIAGARVFDDGYGPEPIWEQIRPDQRCEWGAVTNSAGKYSFLTWPEHHTIKVQSPGYKVQRRSLYSGHFTFNKKDQEIFDFSLESEKIAGSSEFKTTLPNGVTVELIGICEHPSKGKQWWRPDGSLLENRPYEKCNYHNDGRGSKYELAFRVVNLPDPAFGWTIKSEEITLSALSEVSKDGRDVPDIRSAVVGFQEKSDKKDIGLGIAAGSWTGFGHHPTRGITTTSDGIVFQRAIQDSQGNIVLNIIHNINQSEKSYRVVAIGKNGTEYTAHYSGGVSRPAQPTITETVFNNLKLNDVKEFLFQTRPYEWCEFKNVSLKPNFKTDVQAESILAEIIEPEKAGISLPIRKVSSVKNDKSGTFEWETSIDPRIRLCFGRYMVEDGVIKGHKGAGGNQVPQKGRINLKLDVELKDNMLNIQMQREDNMVDSSGTVTMAGKTAVPPGSYLKHGNSIDSAFLTNKHLTLWQGDFIRDGKVIKSVIYAAYLTTPDDWETGFKPPVLQKPEFATAKEKPDVQVELGNTDTVDWIIEDYGQTRLLSDKEIIDTDNWVSVWASAVKNKGRYLVPDRGLTLKGLIKAAGYNKDKLAESYVELIRRSQQGDITTRSTYSRNLKTLLSGEESDVVIKPHDAVSGGYVEPSANGVEFWSGYHFSEVVEMTVNDDGAEINMFADLDTGKLITLPDTLNNNDENAVMRWIKDNGIDVMGETAAGVHGLAGFNMYAARVDNYFWDADPLEFTDRLLVRIDDPVLLSVENLQPVTYLIKTSEYKIGILQTLGFVENPKGIKIRYKLLNKADIAKPDTQVAPELVSGDWQYIGPAIPPDFNDIMILTEHIELGSIGRDAERKTFITFIRDGQEAQNRQYRFVLFTKDGNLLEPDGHVVLGEGKRLEEKFTFSAPFITRQLKGFRFQSRPLPPSGIDNISSQLQKSTHVFDFETIIPSDLAPPGRYAVELDGIDDYLLVPDSPSLRLEPPFTIEMWVKTKLPPEVSEYRGGWAVISKGFTVGTPRAYLTGFGINLGRRPNKPSQLYIDYCKANNSGTYSATYAGYPLTNGVSDWIHITHVFKGEYYKSTPGHPLVMGKFLIPTENPFKGQFGEVRLWNGARTRQELRQYENVALTGTESGLAACWTFEQTKGRYAYDISGNNNHARLGKFTGPDNADPKWIDLQAPPPQPDLKTNMQIEDKRSRGEGVLMLEGFYSFGEGERYSKRLGQIFSKVQTYIEQMSADYENKDWNNFSEAAIQVRDIFFSLKEAIEVDDAAAWEAFTKMWKGEKTNVNDVRLVDLARLKRTFEILAFVGGVYHEETHQNLCTSIVNIADMAGEIQKTLRSKRSAMISSHIEKLQVNWAVLTEIEGIKKIFKSGFRTKDKTSLQVKEVEPESEYVFGPVIDCIVHAVDAGKDSFIDLDTGKAFSSEKIGTKDREELLRAKGIDISVLNINSALKWIDGDVLLGCYDMIAVGLKKKEWETITPIEVTQKIETGQRVPNRGLPVKSIAGAFSPSVYAIGTREGGMGIIRILGFTDNPKCIKIRYKMVKKAPGRKTDLQVND